MKSLLKTALPGLDDSKIKLLQDKLEEIGVLQIEDFQYIEENHISDVLQPIQCKKFLHFCKEKLSSAYVVTLPEPDCSIQSINTPAQVGGPVEENYARYNPTSESDCSLHSINIPVHVQVEEQEHVVENYERDNPSPETNSSMQSINIPVQVEESTEENCTSDNSASELDCSIVHSINMPVQVEEPVGNGFMMDNAVSIASWAENFVINWDLFPKELMTAVTQKKVPPRKHQNEMIRCLVSQIQKFKKYPGRKVLRIIASKVVAKYPDSFQDHCGGSSNIMKKLENCIENRNRNNGLIEKNFIDDATPFRKKRKTIKASYGCINWQPTELPKEETLISQKEHQEWLLKEHTKTIQDDDKVAVLMERTFASQRFYINNMTASITSVKNTWPFLFEKKYLLAHAKTLLGFNIENIFCSSVSIKGERVYKCMKSQVHIPMVKKIVKDIEDAKKKLQNLTPEAIGAIYLLMAFFKEDKELLIKEKDPSNANDVLTPYITTFGSSIYTADEFAVVIDGESVIITNTFASALTLMFASYYVFNIEYNKGTAHTMEFLQRCYANINPQIGSKAPRRNNKHYTISPKILDLVNKMASEPENQK